MLEYFCRPVTLFLYTFIFINIYIIIHHIVVTLIHFVLLLLLFIQCRKAVLRILLKCVKLNYFIYLYCDTLYYINIVDRFLFCFVCFGCFFSFWFIISRPLLLLLLLFIEDLKAVLKIL